MSALMLALAGVAYAEVFEGTRGPNRYAGTSNSGRAELYAGDDMAFGKAGSVKLFGHTGNDVLLGEAGEEKLFGARGKDTIYTGPLEASDRESDESPGSSRLVSGEIPHVIS